MYKIECKAGKTLPVADALSRLPASYQHDASTVESINNDTREYVLFAEHFDTTQMSSSDLSRATKAESTLKQVAFYIRDGWLRNLPR
ncbi:hypothetical protein MTO96_012499 [Rhipicephalus appendiculatus]